MIYDKARELASLMQQSDEFRAFKQCKEKAMESDSTAALIKQYHSLQIKAQASIVSGQRDEACIAELQKLGELLQLNGDAANYLIAEYKLNRMLSDVYKLLAEAVETDLGPITEG